MATTQHGPTYTPTPGELNEAIATCLAENETSPTLKETVRILKSEHVTWKLTERRVQKYLRKQKKARAKSDNLTSTGDDDDDISVASSISGVVGSAGKNIRNLLSPSVKKNKTSPKKGKRGLFRRKSKKTGNNVEDETVPVFPLNIVMDVNGNNRNNILGDLEEEAEDEVPEELSTEEMKSKELYHDDNSGQVESANVCDACVIS